MGRALCREIWPCLSRRARRIVAKTSGSLPAPRMAPGTTPGLRVCARSRHRERDRQDCGPPSWRGGSAGPIGRACAERPDRDWPIVGLWPGRENDPGQGWLAGHATRRQLLAAAAACRCSTAEPAEVISRDGRTVQTRTGRSSRTCPRGRTDPGQFLPSLQIRPGFPEHCVRGSSPRSVALRHRVWRLVPALTRPGFASRAGGLAVCLPAE